MCAVSFFFWAVEDQRCGEALELGGHGHRNPPRCHADTRSDLDHDSGIPLQISTEIRTMYPNHVKRWGPHPERCPRLSRQAGQQGILTEPHMLRKLASPSPSLNYIAAEISLLLEDLKIPRLVLHHIPGVLNVETDWLSHMHDRKARPASLDKVPIKTLEPLRVEQFQLKPPGALKAEEGGSVTYQSGVLTNLE